MGIPYKASDINKLRFSAIYNLQPIGDYSPVDTSSQAGIERIYQNYIARYESDFQGRSGMSPKEYIKESGIQKAALENHQSFIDDMVSKKEVFSVEQKKLKEYVSRILDGTETTVDFNNKYEEQIRKWSIATQNYLDTLSKVDSLYYDYHQDEQEINTISMDSVSEMFKLEKGQYTTLKTAKSQMALAQQEVEKLNALGSEAYQKQSGIVKTTSKSGKNSYRGGVFHNLGALNGSMSSITGFALESQVASGLQKIVGESLSNVSMLGAAEGVTVKLSNGRDLNIKTSKTDVAVTDINGLKINLSIKNQQYSKTKKRTTKLNQSNLDNIIKLVANSREDGDELGGHIMWNINDTKTKNKFRVFLATLTADYAVAMGGQDRVDFMVYNNTIVPLGEYYELLSKKLRLNFTTSKTQKQFREYLRDKHDSPSGGFSTGISTTYTA